MLQKRRSNLFALKSSRGGAIPWSLELPFAFLLCVLFFLAGFFSSALFSEPDEGSAAELRPKPRVLQEENGRFNLQPHGSSGDGEFTSIPFQVLSMRPRTVHFPNFATAEQCEQVIQIAKPELSPSTLGLRPGEPEESSKGVRTSSGMFMYSEEDETGVLLDIEEKIARVTMIPRDHGEAFNIVRYEIGQLYQSHFDAFLPSEYGSLKSQRVATFLLYLSDVEEGGETMFPYEGGAKVKNYNFQDCIGLRVKPRQGDGILFYSLFPNGTIDLASAHGSCPVIKGEKWVATKWIEDIPGFLGIDE